VIVHRSRALRMHQGARRDAVFPRESNARPRHGRQELRHQAEHGCAFRTCSHDRNHPRARKTRPGPNFRPKWRGLRTRATFGSGKWRAGGLRATFPIPMGGANHQFRAIMAVFSRSRMTFDVARRRRIRGWFVARPVRANCRRRCHGPVARLFGALSRMVHPT
jgi:hypothetical protein